MPRIAPVAAAELVGRRPGRRQLLRRVDHQGAPEFSAERRVYFGPAGTQGQAHAYMPMGGGRQAQHRRRRDAHHDPRLPPAGLEGHDHGPAHRLRQPRPGQAWSSSRSTPPATRGTTSTTRTSSAAATTTSCWSRDYAFLRDQIGRIRTRHAVHHARVRHAQPQVHLHDLARPRRPQRRAVRGRQEGDRPGEGIGSNYWDLLPFGGEDALATIYYYDALLDLAELEEQIAAHPAVGRGHRRRRLRPGRPAPARRRRSRTTAPSGSGTRRPAASARSISTASCTTTASPSSTTRPSTTASPRPSRPSRSAPGCGRADRRGRHLPGAGHLPLALRPASHDEAQHRLLLLGAGPAPESHPVRLPGAGRRRRAGLVVSRPDGPADDRRAGRCGTRLGEICAWFDETQAAGGYRAYYSDPARGTMQGGNVPGRPRPGQGVLRVDPRAAGHALRLPGLSGRRPTVARSPRVCRATGRR